MSKKRDKRVKAKLAARRKWLREQRKQYKQARKLVADFEFGIYSKPPGGKWQLEYNSKHEACRDAAFEILKLRTDIEVRRVNL